MESKTDDSGPGGIDVAPYAEIDLQEVPVDAEARIALYEIQRERGATPEEPLEAFLQAKLEREGRTLNIDKGPVNVAPYAEIDLPEVPADSEARIALLAIQRERGTEPTDGDAGSL